MPLVKAKNSQNTLRRRKGKDRKGGEQRCRLEKSHQLHDPKIESVLCISHREHTQNASRPVFT